MRVSCAPSLRMVPRLSRAPRWLHPPPICATSRPSLPPQTTPVSTTPARTRESARSPRRASSVSASRATSDATARTPRWRVRPQRPPKSAPPAPAPPLPPGPCRMSARRLTKVGRPPLFSHPPLTPGWAPLAPHSLLCSLLCSSPPPGNSNGPDLLTILLSVFIPLAVILLLTLIVFCVCRHRKR